MAERSPSELEQRVLAILWERGPSSVRDVAGALDDGKERAYTTVLSILQGMERKRLVRHTCEGQANIYHPRVKRDQVVKPILQKLMDTFFAGDPTRVVQGLLENDSMTPDKLERIRAVIEAAQAEQAESANVPRKPKRSS